MKIFTRSLLALLLIGGMAFSAVVLSAVPPPKKVLVLFPFQPDFPVSKLALQTIEDEFARVDDMALTVYYEFMDSNRFSDSVYQQQLFDLYAKKYGDEQIDLVLIETETTLSQWLEQRGNIAPAAPVVYFDTLSETFAALPLPTGVTGIGGILDYAPSLEWIMALRPTIEEVVLVHGVGAIDLVPDNIRPVETLVQKMAGKVRFTNLSHLPLPEINRRVANLSPTSVVLSHPFFEDATGRRFDPKFVLEQLTAVSPVPVITGFDLSIGTGTIGGKMYSFERQARQAAQIGLRILRGESASAIPRITDEDNPFIFDHMALQRADIPLAALPPNSIVRNRQYTLWELYRPQIIASSTGIAGLLLMIVFLLGMTRQLNRARLALADLNANLETLVQERTATLKETNTQLQNEVMERKQLAEELQRRATTDGLTGIANRRHFLDLLQVEVKRALRLKHPLSIAMIDLDKFKQLNDHYGHAAGDQALLAFVRTCQGSIRDIDILARFGGDEFVMLLPHTHCTQAALVLERVRSAVEMASLDIGGQEIRFTISAGITQFADAQESLDTLLARADKALYLAKEAGRNQVAVTGVDNNISHLLAQ